MRNGNGKKYIDFAPPPAKRRHWHTRAYTYTGRLAESLRLLRNHRVVPANVRVLAAAYRSRFISITLSLLEFCVCLFARPSAPFVCVQRISMNKAKTRGRRRQSQNFLLSLAVQTMSRVQDANRLHKVRMQSRGRLDSRLVPCLSLQDDIDLVLEI